MRGFESGTQRQQAQGVRYHRTRVMASPERTSIDDLLQWQTQPNEEAGDDEPTRQ